MSFASLKFTDPGSSMGATLNQEFVRTVVADVWAEVLPYEPMREDLIWSEAGVDSLKSLQILLSIEQHLGRKLSFDVFARDLTLGDLIRTLADGEAAGEAADAADKRTLFLAPGIFGDEPRLANLRRALRDHVACHTLPLPEIDQTSQVLSDLTATAQPLVRRILEAQPEGPIAVAGYSFGSLVAYQIALELRQAGREVDLLCLIDSAPPAARPVAAPADPVGGRSAGRRGFDAIPRLLKPQPNEGPYLYLERIAFRVLMVSGRFGMARWLAAHNMKRYDFERWHSRRHHLLEVFRRRAMRTWRPAPFDGRVLLIESEALHDTGYGKLWTRWCPNLDVAVVGGDHLTMFEPAPLARLVPALVRAMRLAPPADARSALAS